MTETTTPQGSADLDELEVFRRQWLEEVRKKKAATSSGGPLSGSTSADPGAATSTSTEHAPDPIPTRRRRTSGEQLASHDWKPVYTTTSVTADRLAPALQRAVDIYRRAVQHEQQSELDQALQLYRTAFRLDPNVDRVYHQLESQAARATAGKTHKKTSSTTSAGSVDTITEAIQALTVAHPPRVPLSKVRGDGFVTGTLAGLIASWPRELAFEPEDEKEGVPLETIPPEVLILVLRMLDHTALERFASVNRKARAITLDATIWREFVEQSYKPPILDNDEEMQKLVVHYMEDYRRFYIEQPRVRFDGLYIAVCHYIRNGLGENPWVNYSHLITYHRYLRFFPDGTVLSLLANEDLTPKQVIPVLKPTLRMKGFYTGNWYLSGTEVYITNLLEASNSPNVDARYSFQMQLDLRSRPLGRWNRLDFRLYESVNIGSGEASPLALKNERPFWFSKVRSYA